MEKKMKKKEKIEKLLRHYQKKEKEKCVICGKETEYLRSTPINKRKYYVEGCGQVCTDCGNEMGIE
ncbi:MAG TPA: hypothetical protein ENN45_03855 [Bacteroidetes bacterium]|nr:hypothetical protein [Bacteroidota bacterium]